MKRFLRIAAIAAGLGAAAWLVRDRLLPTPAAPVGPAPSFRAPADQDQTAAHQASVAPAPVTPVVDTIPDDLAEINGIGPVYSERLHDAGIRTFAALAEADAGSLAASLEVREDQVTDWISQARVRRDAD